VKIAEAARASGLSAHTIRYYEASGMLAPIARGPDGHRRFSPENLDWLVLLASLRETGMPTREMKRFAHLYREGDARIPERRQMLRDHEARLAAHQLKLKACRELLAFKLARYAEILGETA